MSHSNSIIDFTKFNSALIVGKLNNSDLYSNGAGKTTIFRAIEYVLFNEIDYSLDKIVRWNTNSCKLVFDFILNNNLYRIVRTRSKKGSSDVSLYHFLNEFTSIQDVVDLSTPKNIWKDISGRRNSDTEKEIAKIIKINYKSFQNTVHFVQNENTGLATTTPEKRKSILRESLNLAMYSKLEEYTKKKFQVLEKDFISKSTLLESIGDPDNDVIDLQSKIPNIDNKINDILLVIEDIKSKINPISKQRDLVISQLAELQSKFNAVKSQKESLEKYIDATNTKISRSKNNSLSLKTSAKNIVAELKALKEQLEVKKSSLVDIEPFELIIQQNKEKEISLGSDAKSLQSKLVELSVPVPEDTKCKSCRHILTKEYIDECKKDISIQIEKTKVDIAAILFEITKLKQENISTQNQINNNKKISENVKSILKDIEYKEKDIVSKKSQYNDSNAQTQTLENELATFIVDLTKATEDYNNFDLSNKLVLEKQKAEIDNNLSVLNSEVNTNNNKISELKSEQAIINFTINKKKEDIIKKKKLSESLVLIQNDMELLPDVIKSFSSTGIPNLIIQNILDDLQTEANNILGKIKPGMQLCFYTEKEKDDGTTKDTLDISYFINANVFDYQQLSGAQKLAVSFSLKLGLSLILQDIMDVNIKFLLLDEIDQSFDKASVDSFSEMIRGFDSEYQILVITHNDRLKDKFDNIILVEQDINGVSAVKAA